MTLENIPHVFCSSHRDLDGRERVVADGSVFSFPSKEMQRAYLSREQEVFIALVIFTASVLVWILSTEFRWSAWPEHLLFFVLIAIASRFPILDPRGGIITVAGTLFLVLISIHGPAAGLIVAAPAYALGTALSRGWVPWRTIFNWAQMGISVVAAGVVFKLTGGSAKQPGVLSLVIPLGAAVIAHQTFNNFFVSFHFSRLRRTPFLNTWLMGIRDLLLPNLLGVPTAALLATLYVLIHPAALLVFLAFMPLQRRAHQLLFEQKRIYDQAINSLVLAVDADFPQGRGHSRRVADMAMAIARQMNLSDQVIEEIELAALIHDVGMIGLDELGEESAGEDRASRGLREHVELGAAVAHDLPLRGVSEIVLHHHENYDGSGYPNGLKGRNIPLGARIVAVAEAYESMLVGGFPYAKEFPRSEVMTTIRNESGKSFDPHVVNAFSDVLGAGSTEE